VVIVPGGLDEDATAMGVPCFGDGPTMFSGARGMFPGNESEVRHERARGAKASDIVDFDKERHGGQGLDAPQATKGLGASSVGRGLSVALDLCVKRVALHFEILEVLEFGSQGRLQGAIELFSEMSEPAAMGFRLGGLAFGKDISVAPQDAGDAVFGGRAVTLIGIAKANELAQGFLFLGRDMDGCEMTTSVEPGQHDGVEPIGLAMITGLAGDERRSDDLAMEPIVGEHAVKDESGTGGLVAGTHRSLFCETAKETAHFHQIAGKLEDLGVFPIPLQNGGGNGLGMYI